MIDSRLLSKMGGFEYFKWQTKDMMPGGCSVGFGFSTSTGWIRRTMKAGNQGVKFNMEDLPVQEMYVPEDIMQAHKLRK